MFALYFSFFVWNPTSSWEHFDGDQINPNARVRGIFWRVYGVFICAAGRILLKEGFWCQRISQTAFDSRDRLYLNKATILRENPANLLIPISVFGRGDSRILLICFCLSGAVGGLETEPHSSVYLSVCLSVWKLDFYRTWEHQSAAITSLLSPAGVTYKNHIRPTMKYSNEWARLQPWLKSALLLFFSSF